MKNLIDWIKSNPIVTACAVVSLLGIVVVAYFYVVSAPQYGAAKSELLKEPLQRQKNLQNVSVPLPNKDPNAPADNHPVVINQIVINDVGSIYRKIQTQYEEILGNAQTKNSQNHIQVLLGGSSIWPDADTTQFFDIYVEAKEEYKNHFKAVFDKEGRGNKWNMPRMFASGPPTAAELELILSQSAYDYISSVGAQSTADLSQSQADQLYAEQRMKLMEALNNRARSIHLYTTLPAEEDPFAPEDTEAKPGAPVTGSQPGFGFGGPAAGAGQDKDALAGYPFHIADWAFSDQPPAPDQLWEGQVQLWIMRDIMRTIHSVNRVGRNDIKAMGPDGVIRDEPASVVNSPIKRLLKLQTLHGYVGMHNTGAALGGATTNGDISAAGAGFAAPSPAGGGIVGSAVASTPSIYPAPPADLIEVLKPKEVTDNAVEHFGITPTGRISNSVFDVRHTQLTIDIEAAKLPAFIEALNQANFMTVIKADITDLDEYALLREGYVYGHNDVVRAELIVESLWFRNWTEAIMPKIVKEKLLIILPEIDPNAPQDQPF